MGCGNNKVTSDYLTSQPVTTPSSRAAKASKANLHTQVQRMTNQVSQQGVDRAAQASAGAAHAAREAKGETREQREHERLRDDPAYRAAAFAPNQPTTYNGHPAWDHGVKSHSGGFQYMTRPDGMTTTEPIHVSTRAKPDGGFDVHLSDHVNSNGRIETFDLEGEDAADDLFIAACQEHLYEIMQSPETDS